MKHITDITDTDIHAMDAIELATLIGWANRDATIVENKNVQSRNDAWFVRRARHVESVAKQALQAINLGRGNEMGKMISGEG